MNKNVGVWIDHKKAVVVCLKEGSEEIHTIASDIEKHARYAGGVPEDQIDHRFANHLKEFYGKVIASIHDANAILILGPGEAKVEFEKQLIAEAHEAQLDGIETEDKMTDHQIAAKVKEHFLHPVDEPVVSYNH